MSKVVMQQALDVVAAFKGQQDGQTGILFSEIRHNSSAWAQIDAAITNTTGAEA